jgi:hypothetical protein
MNQQATHQLVNSWLRKQILNSSFAKVLTYQIKAGVLQIGLSAY